MDNFSNNKNNWFTGFSTDSCYNSKIENGTYEITSNCKGTYPLCWTTQTIDIARDFEIEAEIMYVKGEDNNAASLVWSMDSTLNRICFGFSGYGQYVIRKYEGTWSSITDWTTSDLVHKSEYNKLTIRKIKDWYYFFLNETLVQTCLFRPFDGRQLGFQDNQNTTMRVNCLKVSYLKPNSKPNLSTYHQKDNVQSIELSGLCGSFGMGYIHSTGEIRDLWTDGFDIDILIGYLFLSNFGLECGFNYGLTGISEDKKVTVGVVDSYGNTSTRTTSGGRLFFPCRVKVYLSNIF